MITRLARLAPLLLILLGVCIIIAVFRVEV